MGDMNKKEIKQFEKIIITKVGDYDGETLIDILTRKKWEEQNTGEIWWGFKKSRPKPETIQYFVQQGNSDVLFLMVRNDKGNDFHISDFSKDIKEISEEFNNEYRTSDSDDWRKCTIYTSDCKNAFVFTELTDAGYYIDTSCYRVYCDIKNCKPNNKILPKLDTHYAWMNSITKPEHGTFFDTFCAKYDPSLVPKKHLLKIDFQAKLVTPYCVELKEK